MKNCPKLDSYSNAHLSDTFLLDHRFSEEYLKPHLSGIGQESGVLWALGDDIVWTQPLMKMKNKLLPFRNIASFGLVVASWFRIRLIHCM